MSGAILHDFVIVVLQLLAKFAEQDALYWLCDGSHAPITFFVNCSDKFWWGCADSERVVPENLAHLELALSDIAAIDETATRWAPMLFCARLRAMRPQGTAYPKNSKLWTLFDACGPVREPRLGDPQRAPSEAPEY